MMKNNDDDNDDNDKGDDVDDDDDDDDDDDNDDDEEIGKLFPFLFQILMLLPGIHTQRSGSAGICGKNKM